MPCGNANDDCLTQEIRKKLQERKDADEDGLSQTKGEMEMTSSKGKMEMSLGMAYLKQRGRWKCQRGWHTSSKGEDGNVTEEGLPQAKEKMEVSARMAYPERRGIWKCQ
jgi:hypothetical protein